MSLLSVPLRLIIKPMRWAWLHKIRSASYTSTALIIAYACIFTLVSCATSPTTLTTELSGHRALAYEAWVGPSPEGPSVVLVHGAPADASSWNRLLKDHLGDMAVSEAVAVDRLGYGNSSPGLEDSLAAHAASLLPFLDLSRGQKPILVGHSYGGPVVLRAAVDYPTRVGGVILVAGACDATMEDSQSFRRAVDSISLVVPEPWEVANAELLALTDENRAMTSLLGEVTCPVVIIHGTWDAVCPHDSTIAYLQTHLVNAAEVRVVSLERTGHNIHLSDRGTLAQEIRRLANRADH